jgi:hypothetical protein
VKTESCERDGISQMESCEKRGISRRPAIAGLGAVVLIAAALARAAGIRQSPTKAGEWEVDVTLGVLQAVLLAAGVE